MMARADGPIGTFLRAHWVTLLSWVVMLGVGYGVHTVNMQWIDTRLQQIERQEPAKVKWQLEEQEKVLSQMKSDDKLTQTKIANIEAQISVINTKLDNIVALLKEGRDRKPL